MDKVDTAQITQAQHGNSEAFTHLVDAYQAPVYNLCYRMLGDAGEAEDAAQETFLRAYLSLKKYDLERSFMTWILSIAAHYCIDQIRKRHLQTSPLDILPEEDAPDPAPSPEGVFNASEENRRVRALLKSLDPQDRAAVIMRYWYDFSDQEIGDSLSLTVSAVKSRLHRARRELAVQWQQNTAQSTWPERRIHEPSTC